MDFGVFFLREIRLEINLRDLEIDLSLKGSLVHGLDLFILCRM